MGDNQLIVPFRRMKTLILAFDRIYDQCLLGLLGLATRELTHHKQDRQKVMPYDVERMKQYVEIIRQRFGAWRNLGGNFTRCRREI